MTLRRWSSCGSGGIARFGPRWPQFAGASFHRADLTEADLRGANLQRADLHGARLTGARLGGADLTGANLDSATLIGAELAGAAIADITMRHAIFDQATTWPIGFHPPRPEGVGYWRGAK